MIEQIGGVFLYSNSPKALAEWYQKAFQLEYQFEMEDSLFGLSLFYTDEQQQKRYVVFSIAKAKEPLSESREKTFTLNLRVKDMDAQLAHLKQAGVDYRGPEIHEEGKFAWIQDPDGNYLEMWEDPGQQAN